MTVRHVIIYITDRDRRKIKIKGEIRMLKNYVEERGIKIVVNDNNLNYYKDGILVAETWGFINEDSTKEHEGRIAIKLHKHVGILEEFGWLTLEKEKHEELLNIRLKIRIAIEKYFNNLENASLEKLSNGSIVFAETTELYKKLKELNENYFIDVKEDWIKENKKYFEENTEWNKNGMGMMESKTTYTFNKDNIEKVDREIEEYKKTDEYKFKLENEKQYDGLYELAETMSDEDFEDITGIRKEFLING